MNQLRGKTDSAAGAVADARMVSLSSGALVNIR